MWGNVCRVFERTTAEYSECTAILDEDRQLTYTEMGRLTNQVAQGLLELGLQKGDRVALLLPNSLEFIPSLFGLWRAGGAFTQIPTRSSASDIRYFLNEVGVSFLIYHQMFQETLDKIRGEIPSVRQCICVGTASPLPGSLDYAAWTKRQPDSPPDVEILSEDMAMVAFTSGTTGLPKALVINHGSWAHYAITAGLELGDTRPGEVFAHVAPLTHFSSVFVLPTFMRGGTNVMIPTLNLSTFAQTVVEKRVTATAVVPTIIYLMLDLPPAQQQMLTSLRTIVYVGSPMMPTRLKQALDIFGPVFVQGYAGSEPGFVSCLRKEEHTTDSEVGLRQLASAGRPMYHVTVSIQDEQDRLLPRGEAGEICVRSPGQILRYWNDAQTAEAIRNGWIHSGDMGVLDEDGFLYIVDRKKDMIVTGGFNVFPRQVEDVLGTHPAVAQCAVIGVPDEKWGEAVKAFVVLKPGMSAAVQELRDLVKREKGSVWAPKTIEFLEALPLNPSAKPDKKLLRSAYWANENRAVH